MELAYLVHIVQAVIQNVALRFHKLHHPPNRLSSIHAGDAKGIRLGAPDKGHLLQLQLVVAFSVRPPVAAEAHDTEVRAVAMPVTLLFGVGVRDTEDELSEALQVKLVEAEDRYYAAVRAREGFALGRPAADIEGAEFLELEGIRLQRLACQADIVAQATSALKLV